MLEKKREEKGNMKRLEKIKMVNEYTRRGREREELTVVEGYTAWKIQ